MKTAILILSVVLLSAVACSKQDKALTIADQEDAIDSYISGTLGDYPVVRRNGSNRVIIEPADISVTDSLEYGDSLYFYYAGYVFTSTPSTLFATNVEEVATQSGFEITNPDYSARKILYTDNCMISGLVNGLWGVRQGEHCIILFSAEYGFYDDAVYNIPSLSALAFEIWIDRVIKNE